MGFYPVCPGTDQYVLGAPLFKKMTIRLENGRSVVINAASNSSENRYVRSLNLNQKLQDKNYVTHDQLLNGAVLNFQMQKDPDRRRGTGKTSFPYSFSNSPEGK
jgi:putative alpha-1,2-mannosidase